MSRLITLLPFLLVGCMAHRVKTEPEDLEVHTLSYVTGRLADDGLYRLQFERGARRLCDGPYQVLERGREVSTLAGYVTDPDTFYWVVTCQE